MSRSIVLACLLSVGFPAVAWADAPTQDAVAAAKEHFQRAKDLYKAGSYREALAETESAHALDPTAKQLVYNLAVLHEKLSEIDEAIASLQQYLQMNVDPQERERAESFVRRLEGAKREIGRGTSPPPASSARPASPVAPTAPELREHPSEPPSSRGYGASIALGVVSLAGFGVGAFFGLQALSDRPTGFVTGQTGTYADYEQRASNARRKAAIADIAFGVGAVATLGAVYFLFARPDGRAKAALSIGPDAVQFGGSW
jgi:tetratricopeptide (TPR) repeat protein